MASLFHLGRPAFRSCSSTTFHLFHFARPPIAIPAAPRSLPSRSLSLSPKLTWHYRAVTTNVTASALRSTSTVANLVAESALLRAARTKVSSLRSTYAKDLRVRGGIPPRRPSNGFFSQARRRLDSIPGGTIFWTILGINGVVYLSWWFAMESYVCIARVTLSCRRLTIGVIL